MGEDLGDVVWVGHNLEEGGGSVRQVFGEDVAKVNSMLGNTTSWA